MSAAARWRRLVRARMAEVAGLSSEASAHTPQFWDARARRFTARLPGPARDDPFLARVRRSVGRTSTVLDVGCGPGRYALALAARAREVVAVDPSKEMLKHLRRQSRALGIDNIRPVHGSWQDLSFENCCEGGSWTTPPSCVYPYGRYRQR